MVQVVGCCTAHLPYLFAPPPPPPRTHQQHTLSSRGHSSPVLDLCFSPFLSSASLLATGSSDCTVKLWEVNADGGGEAKQTLAGHQRPVRLVRFLPSAPGLLLSASLDTSVCLWDVESGSQEPVAMFGGDQFGGGGGGGGGGSAARLDWASAAMSLSFSSDGRCVVAALRDGGLRILDLRVGSKPAGVLGGTVETSPQGHRVAWAGQTPLICSSGKGVGSDSSKRMLRIFDTRKLGDSVAAGSTLAPAAQSELDRGSGLLRPHYDEGLGVVYLAAKGESSVKAFDLQATETETTLFSCASTQCPGPPLEGMCMVPRRCLNARSVEVARFLRFTRDARRGGCVEGLSFTLPRAARLLSFFQDDIFPPCRSGAPAFASVQAWSSHSTDVAEPEAPRMSMCPEGMKPLSEQPRHVRENSAGSGGPKAVRVGGESRRFQEAKPPTQL